MITVCIPAYKGEYLAHSIRSVLNQSYKDFELIVVDDASPDNLGVITGKFSDSRLKYIRNKENLGKTSLVKNWNLCLSQARGEYFVLFADDDVMDPNFLSAMVSLAQRYPKAALFHSRVCVIDTQGNALSYSPLCPEWESGIEFVWHRLRGFRQQYAPDFLCRTSEIKAIGGFVDFPLGWGSDDATWFLLGKKGGVCYDARPLCNWRYSPSGISRRGMLEVRLRSNGLFSAWLESFLDTAVPTNKIEEFLLNDCISQIEPHLERLNASIVFRTSHDDAWGMGQFLTRGFQLWYRRGVSLRSLAKALLWKLNRDFIQ